MSLIVKYKLLRYGVYFRPFNPSVNKNISTYCMERFINIFTNEYVSFFLGPGDFIFLHFSSGGT
jgi:hypothetical protein